MIKRLNYAILIGSIFAMIVYCINAKISTVGAFISTAIWLSTPAILLLLINWKKPKIFNRETQSLYVSIAVIVTGLYLLIDVTWIHPDPQSPIAVMMLPIVQCFEIGLLAVILSFVSRRR